MEIAPRRLISPQYRCLCAAARHVDVGAARHVDVGAARHVDVGGDGARLMVEILRDEHGLGDSACVLGRTKAFHPAAVYLSTM